MPGQEMSPSFMQKVRRRVILLAAIFVAVVLTIAWGKAWTRSAVDRENDAAAVASAVQLGGPFEMVDHTGKTVTEKDFAGRYKLVYFGFTFCPDVCPTELQSISVALKSMEPEEATKVAPLFVTVDPARDTVEQMAQYVTLFHPALTGLTGTPEQVKAMADTYKVYYAKAQDEDSTDYTMDHSAYVYFMAPDDTLLKIFRSGTPAAEMADEISRLMAGNS